MAMSARVLGGSTIVALFVIAVMDVAVAGVVPGPNANASAPVQGQVDDNQAEAAISVNPLNLNQVFIASQSGPVIGQLFASRSVDAGTNWLASNGPDKLIADGNDSLFKAFGDSATVWDTFGNLFLSYIRIDALNRIAVNLSTNAGVTFSPLTELVGNAAGVDQGHLKIGPGQGGAGETLWAIFVDSSGTRAQAATVTGLGALSSFSPIVTVPGSLHGNIGDIAVGPAGQVAVAWRNDSTAVGPTDIFMALDPDGLGPAPFGTSVPFILTTNVGGAEPIPAQPQRGVDAMVTLDYDRSNGPHRGRLYMVYNNEMPQNSDDLDVYVTYSDSNGNQGTWSAPVRINDDFSTNSQFLPRLAIDQSSGALGVCWHDARNDRADHTPGDIDTDNAPNTDTEFFCSASFTGGATWLTNARVSGGSSNQARANGPNG
jgi:hypothetical protein